MVSVMLIELISMARVMDLVDDSRLMTELVQERVESEDERILKQANMNDVRLELMKLKLMMDEVTEDC